MVLARLAWTVYRIKVGRVWVTREPAEKIAPDGVCVCARVRECWGWTERDFAGR